MSLLFGKKPSPEEMVKKWKRELRREDRNLEKTIRSILQFVFKFNMIGIELEENKLKRSIKDLAKKGDKASAKVLAKEIVRSRKAKERIYLSKAQLNSVSMQLSQNLSMMKVAGCMQKSGQVMAVMNSLVKLPQLNSTMMAMAREMEKAGLIEEVMNDVLDNDAELDDEADQELDKVIDEVVMGLKTTNAPREALPSSKVQDSDSEEEDDLEKRLTQLKQ